MSIVLQSNAFIIEKKYIYLKIESKHFILFFNFPYSIRKLGRYFLFEKNGGFII